MLLPSSAAGQTPAGTPIDNQATATYQLGATPGLIDLSNVHTVVVAVLRTPASVEFLRYAPGAPGAISVSIQPSRCSSTGLAGGPFTPVPPPTQLDGTPIGLPGPLDLLPAPQYTQGEPIFLRLTDPDQNLDSGLVETGLVRVAGAADSELIELTETAPASGIFTGHLQSSAAAVAPGDCVLEAAENETVGASYTDPVDSADTAADSAVISPSSLAFDSQSGAPLSGVVITLIDDTTGLPATVFGDDGVSVFPSTVTTGGTANDGVKIYLFAPGSYRFPWVPAGSYRLDVTPTASHASPSAVADALLQTLPGAPFALSLASRGQPFAVGAASALAVDVPLDPNSASTFLVKTSSTDAVGIGEFLSYNVRARNPGIASAPLGLELRDVLPLGFRYQAGSARLNALPLADPVVSGDARTLLFTLPTTPLLEYQELAYVVEVTSGTPTGGATNVATSLVIGGTESHAASATVLVRDDLFGSSSLLMGQVSVGDPGQPPDPAIPGLAGVRLYLEDGTYAVTDELGYFHFEGVQPGVHVVQLDMDTLPSQYEPVPHTQNTRFSGRSFSQFVDLQGGTLWRTDFRVALRTPASGYVNSQLYGHLDDDVVRYRFEIRGSGVPVRGLRAVTMLPEGTHYVPGSSTLDGEPVPDPERAGNMLTHLLSDEQGRWTRQLEFQARADAPLSDERLVGQAFAMFHTPTARAVRTPVASTTLLGLSQGASGVQLTETLGLRPGEDWPEEPEAEPESEPEADEAETVYDAKWLESADRDLAWLSPRVGFAPPIPSVDIAIKHPALHEIRLLLNGEEVPAINLTGRLQDTRHSVGLTTWNGVDLVEGTNHFEAVSTDPAGEVTGRIEHDIHYAGPPVRAEIVLEESRLVADGKTPPVLAVRLLDRFDMPARQGVVVEFELDPPYVERRDRKLERPRHDVVLDPTRPTAEVGMDGIARIELEPTSETGELKLRLDLAGGRGRELSTWLEPEDREWIMVGLAEGTVGYNTLSGNMDSIDDLDVEGFGTHRQRMSFFAIFFQDLGYVLQPVSF